MSTRFAPLAIFAYNRKDNLERMFASLQACEGFANSPIFIFVDGPKTLADAPKVEAVREYAKALRVPNLELVIRDTNIGLKESIYSGVSHVCQKYGRVIVLEDDLVLSPVTLTYFNAALEKYADAPRVWSISGYQYNVPILKNTSRALVLPFAHPWGWATWARAWSKFNLAAKVDERDLSSPSFACAFDVFGIADFRNMLVLALQGLVNSWFIRWYYTIFSAGGVSIFPPHSYVTNTGIRGGGTHASRLNPYRFLTRPSETSATLCTFPDELKVDFWAIDEIRRSWDARVQNFIIRLGRVKRMLMCGKTQ
jgi:hypothetical protein